MFARAIAISVLLLATGLSASAETATEPTALCVKNGGNHSFFFAAEAPDAERRVQELAPGEVLCVHSAVRGQTGVVSVYEEFDALEGCSRLVPIGRTEVMLKYVDFDRCFWSSNTSVDRQ